MTTKQKQQHVVQHFISVSPEEHVATRARVVRTELVDDVTFFSGDNVIGVLCVPTGLGPALCQQMGLIERTKAVSFETIRNQFEQALRAE